MVEEELEEGLRSIAAPIQDRDERRCGADISTHAVRRSADSIEQDLVRRCWTRRARSLVTSGADWGSEGASR